MFNSLGRWRGPVCLTLAMMLVGSTVVASALAAGRLDPFAASLVRFGVATPLLWAACAARGERWPDLSRSEWLILLFQSAVGSLGYTVALVAGMRYAGAADASVVTGLMPVATGAVAVLALGERPGARLLLAIFVATSGAVLVAAGGRLDTSGEWRLIGLALVFAAVLGEAFFALLNKRISRPIPPLVVATAMSAIALALTLVPGLWAFWRDPDMLNASVAMGAMIYYGVAPTALGFWLWYTGASLSKGAEAAAFTAVAPITAMLLSIIVLGETMQWRHIGGMALVLAAIALTVSAPEKR